MKTYVMAACLLVLCACGGSGNSSAPLPSPIVSGDSADQLSLKGGLWKTWQGDDLSVVILHQGHAYFDSPGYSLVEFAERLNTLGFTVYGFEMLQTPHGPPIEQFYKPVLDLIDALPEEAAIFMIGLSGGGWTTTLVTALSERITKGYSVAGDVPLDMREQDALGDWEQINTPYSYREMYSIAEGRLLHIYNESDPCCFWYEGWTEQELGTPFIVDSTHQEHCISPWAQDFIISDIANYIPTGKYHP